MGDWIEFSSFMQDVKDSVKSLGLRPHQECYFRGHLDTTFKLLPSLFRQGEKTSDEYWKLERRIFFEFRARARQLYSADYSEWDVLFHMQHHGVPTRLLDWTSVFGVALYFSLLNFKDDTEQVPCIWILNPYALNEIEWNLYRLYSPKFLAREHLTNRSYDYDDLLIGDHPKHWGSKELWELPKAIYSHLRSERMFAQSGFFTIHGLNLAPIEEILQGRDEILKKVVLPKGAVSAAREFLKLSGIGHRQLFPDLDGLARSIRDQFGLMR